MQPKMSEEYNNAYRAYVEFKGAKDRYEKFGEGYPSDVHTKFAKFKDSLRNCTQQERDYMQKQLGLK